MCVCVGEGGDERWREREKGGREERRGGERDSLGSVDMKL